MDDDQPLGRRLYRKIIALMLVVVLLATQGFGTFPVNAISSTLAALLIGVMSVELTASLDGSLRALDAPSLVEVAARQVTLQPTSGDNIVSTQPDGNEMQPNRSRVTTVTASKSGAVTASQPGIPGAQGDVGSAPPGTPQLSPAPRRATSGRGPSKGHLSRGHYGPHGLNGLNGP